MTPLDYLGVFLILAGFFAFASYLDRVISRNITAATWLACFLTPVCFVAGFVLVARNWP